ncbi:hypothetical protein ACEWY4_024597 [Coilia grayii]|uniref:PH domain-containing protein n=1 Tax=Coilia grayii TaxID=363190 RepID=A0ABD1IV56_9TELE
MVRRWCTLEGGFLSYYENKKVPMATGRVEISEMMSLAVNRHETMTGAGAVFTFEMYLPTEKVLVLGAETAETHRDWTRAVSKCFLPAEADSILRRDCELIGRLFYKEGHDLYHWRAGWFGLEGSDLHFCSESQAEEGVLQLRRLQEIRQEWTGVGTWSGLEWTGVDWSGLEWVGQEWTGVDWSGHMEWVGQEWTRVDWSGLEWAHGVGRTGVDWSG